MLIAAAVSASRADGLRAGPPQHHGGSAPRRSHPNSPRAPAGPALLAPSHGAEAGAEEAPEGSRPQADPLVVNGLGSPACKSALKEELGAAARRDCETSGFTAAAAPTGNFGFDVHIDTGVIPLSGGSLLSLVQDLFVTPVWLALVWLVRALVVMLEWCFGLDLLGSASGSLRGALSRANGALTVPWLPLALAIAAALVAYHGLVRRRVGQTLGEALAMLAMFACGTWLIVDPVGTVGALSGWSEQAGLGTLAVAARGTPSSPGRALADSMNAVFAVAVEAPWCYLEFGNVGWCRDPGRLDRGLRFAALRLAARELREGHCAAPPACRDAGAAPRLLSSARLLQEARRNGDEFLALPPNGPDRNSINDSGSLLRALCRSSDATACTGPSAAEAEFRTNAGTWPRVGGLLLIVIGLLGMLLLLGYIGLRLLLAAILTMFYLLLTPGIVLLPALGENGRALFRGWAGRLLAAIAAKLVFAFLLGVVLAVIAVLDGLEGLGWWAQWMLMSAFWWGAFLKRNEILAAAPQARAPGELATHARRVRRWHDERRQEQKNARDRRNTEGGGREGPAERLPTRGRSAGSSTKAALPHPSRDEQAERLLAASLSFGRGARREALGRLAAGRSQLDRIKRARLAAVASGERPRAARLASRQERLEQAVAVQRTELSRGGATLAVSAGGAAAASELKKRSALLDRQAELPGMLERRAGEPRRDYAALAGVVGLTHERYRELSPPSGRMARLAIDRQLSARREERGLKSPEFARTDDRVADRTRSAPGQGTPLQPPRRPPESRVMRDVREVAEGRKRELGFDRP